MRFSATSPSMAAIWDATPDAIIIYDGDGVIHDWNTNAVRLFGHERFAYVCDLIANVDEHRLHVRLCRELDTTQSFSSTARRHNGQQFDVLCSVRKFVDDDIPFYVEVFRDASTHTESADQIRSVTVDIASAKSLDQAYQRCVDGIAASCSFSGVHLFILNEDELVPTNHWAGQSLAAFDEMIEATKLTTMQRGEGLPGQTWEAGTVLNISGDAIAYRLARRLGSPQYVVKQAIGVPVMAGDDVIGVIECFQIDEKPIPEKNIDRLRELGRHAGIIFERFRRQKHLRSYAETLEETTEALTHQVKNTISVISGLALQTARSCKRLEEFLPRFEARLSSLLMTHKMLARNQWWSAQLHDIVELHLDRKYIGGGPYVTLTTHEALTVSIALHEMVVNAKSHGGLRGEDGSLSVTWRVVDDMVELIWTETIEGIDEEQLKSGFGSRLIRESVSYQIQGKTTVTTTPTELIWKIIFPATLVD